MPCNLCGKDSGKFHGGSCPECLVERVRELEISNDSLIGAIDSAIIEARKLLAQTAAMRDALNKALAALNAPTHEANDYNCEDWPEKCRGCDCEDWPPGKGCRGCAGDEQREQAVKQIEATLAALEGDGSG